MEYVKLPIFVTTPKAKFKLKGCKVIPDVPFFKIDLDLVFPYFEGGKEYSQIIISGESYYSTLTVNEVLHEVLSQEESEFIYNFNILSKN